jgi:hypothetical protein
VNSNQNKSDLTKRHQTNWHQKIQTTTPQHGTPEHGKNNKQKPPNTLLSSQTTHPLAAQRPRGDSREA